MFFLSSHFETRAQYNFISRVLDVKNYNLDFGFSCDVNQPLPRHPILVCQMLLGLNLKTAILISTPTLTKFLWHG